MDPRAGGPRPLPYADKPIGINVMLMDPRASEVAELVCELGVEVVTTGAGSPANYMKMWKEAGVKVVPVVASRRWPPAWSASAPTPWWPRARKPADISAS